jgi:hypothetical protein
MAGNQVRVGFGVSGVGKASSDLDRMKDKFEKLQKQGAKGFAIGVGAGVAVGAIGLISTAASQLTNVLGDSIAAALEEEVSIQKLGTSLRANVANWDGNTKAIERVVTAQMALGFSDDEQRDSLAKLVAATHDVTKALAIQRTAMDLARFKGISLADATDALTKVEAGSFRVLKSLGIVLKDGATQTEALAAVQAVARGQAEAYAKTNSGKLLISQVKVGEAMEKFGGSIMPLVADATALAADKITELSDAYTRLSGLVADTADVVKEETGVQLDLSLLFMSFPALIGATADAYKDLRDAISGTVDPSKVTGAALRDDWRAVDGTIGEAAGSIGDSLGDDGVGGSFQDVTGEARAMRRMALKASEDMRDSFANTQEAMSETAQSMIDDFFDPIEIRSELMDTRAQLRADEETLRLAKGKGEHRNATEDIIQDLDDQATALIDLGKKGKLTRKDVLKFEKDTRAAYHKMGIEVPKDVLKIFAALEKLAGLKAGAIDISFSIPHRPGTGHLEFASGGVVPGRTGEPQLAIVHGGETVIPTGQPGYAGLSAGLSASGGVSASVSVTVVVNPSMGMTPGDGRAFGEAAGPALVAWMQRNGHLSRTASPMRG